MQYKMFAVPAVGGESEEERMNHFLRTVRVVDVSRELVDVQGVAHWCFCVTFLPLMAGTSAPGSGARVERKGKVDYKAELPEAAFRRFDVMRKARRKIAEAECVPAYVVFTDAELAAIARMDRPTAEGLAGLEGVDRKRAATYGARMLDALAESRQPEGGKETADEAGGTPL